MVHVTIKIGDKKTFKKSFLRGLTILYCGMPTDKTFCLGLRECSGYQGYSWNLHFKLSEGTITIKGILN